MKGVKNVSKIKKIKTGVLKVIITINMYKCMSISVTCPQVARAILT